MKFELTADEARKAKEWLADHGCEMAGDDAGAIGGKISYTFTPTGVGTAASVHCWCGRELGLTDYSTW